MRETKYEKARRLFDDGRVRLVDGVETDADRILVYEVDGDSKTYRVEADVFGAVCDCPAYRRCSHAIAVKLFENEMRRRWRTRVNDVNQRRR